MEIINMSIYQEILSVNSDIWMDDNNAHYHKSKYVVSDFPDQDNVLLYNTATCELLQLSLVEYGMYNNVYFHVDNEAQSLKKYLVEHLFLIHNTINEQNFVEEKKQLTLKTKNASHTPHKISSVVIFTTTACNARCGYCYEKDTNIYTMTEDVAWDTAKYLVSHADTNHLTIKWFGGEPLLNKKAIDIICNYLIEHNINFNSRITTNGYLLNTVQADTLCNVWKVSSVQITLDGTKDKYKHIKNYQNSDPDPFETVLQNIQYIRSLGIRTSLRSNFSLENANNIKDLIDYMYDRYPDEFSKMGMYVAPMYEGCGDPPYNPSSEELELVHKKYEELTLYLNELKKFSNLMIFGVSNIKTIRSCHCMADTYGANPCITPTGNLTICEHHIDDEIYGTIWDDVYNYDILNKWQKDWTRTKYCNSCFYYPQCLRIDGCVMDMTCTQTLRDFYCRIIKTQMRNAYKNNTTVVLVDPSIQQYTSTINCIINEQVHGGSHADNS